MDDNSIMPFGKHEGKKLIDVPDDYLIWFYKNNKFGNTQLLKYIKESFDLKQLS